MNIIDTRDLYKRQQELQDLKTALESREEELLQANDDLAAHKTSFSGPSSEGQEAHDEKTEELAEIVSDAEDARNDALADFAADEKEELDELDELESEISNWMHGESMIQESDFEDYARELADDIGAINRNAQWPLNCIDWEQAAKELAMDYSIVTYQGTDYYVRS
jgi:hypothetical protein